MEIHDFAQGSEDWLAVRRGIPTASAMKQLFTVAHAVPKKPTAAILNYAAEMAADSFSGLPLSNEEGFQGNWATERGHELEPVARREYDFLQDDEVTEVGFITNHGCGCSPDALVGDEGLLEIKCLLAKAHTQAVAECVAGQCPADYFIQCQAQMWITGRKWCDLYFYHPHLSSAQIRVKADTEFFSLLETQTQLVIAERDKLINALDQAA